MFLFPFERYDGFFDSFFLFIGNKLLRSCIRIGTVIDSWMKREILEPFVIVIKKEKLTLLFENNSFAINIFQDGTIKCNLILKIFRYKMIREASNEFL